MTKTIKPEVIQALAWYRWNTGTFQIIEDIYGTGHHERYLEEKESKLIERGLLFLYCELDGSHQQKLVDAVEAKYADYFAECGVAGCSTK